jgi:hypothetical protein
LGYNPGFPDRFIAGTNQGAFLSINHGLDWSSFAYEMEGKTVVSLNFNPADRSSVYLGSDGRGTLQVFLH